MSSEPSKEIARFADVAMFEAEPIDVQAGPQVHLLWMTPDPLGAIAAACKMYKGEVVRDLSTVTDVERREYLAQVTRTKLKAPFEFVKFHFLIEGVTRSFTHQLVRQRTAVYAQESLRFAVKEDMPVSLPPSIPPGSPTEDIWNDAIDDIQSAYIHLINSGIPAEDARGLLPHNVMTRVHYSTDLRALLDHAGNRLCTQAQFEWRIVFSKIAEAIRAKDDVNSRAIGGPVHDGIMYSKMASELASLFAPVCYQTGKCEFKAEFDRHCSIRDRVEMNHSAGIESSRWGTDHWVDVPVSGSSRRLEIQAIRPEEWLLNHAAARKRA